MEKKDNEKVVKRNVCLSIIRDELNTHGVVTRSRIIKLFMDKLGVKQLTNGSIPSTTDSVIAILRKQGFLEIKERGLYVKI